MNLKLIILIVVLLAKTSICNAQGTTQVYSQNKEANSYYAKALHYIEIGTPSKGGSPDSLQIAVQYLQKAVKADPNFVNAYIELCRTYWKFNFSFPNYIKYYGNAPSILPKAKIAISKALRIDSASSHAYSELGRMNLFYEYKFDEALKNFAKAIKYDSTNAANYAYYGETLALQGKWDEAQQWLGKANKISPNDASVLVTTGWYYHWQRKYDTAEQYFNKINPESWARAFYLCLNDIAKGKAAQGVEILKSFDPSGNGILANGGTKALLAYALIKSGQIDEARKLLKKTEELNQVVNYRSAICYVALGEYDKAFELLNNELNEQHDNWLIWLKYDNAWDAVHNDKRYKEVLKKMPFDK
ncbi:MAG: tetratricopeptide repeat protein [Bacteroidota bacterium]|nr:tetratricopeptide repeat protein [Bacteroidota bacterium]